MVLVKNNIEMVYTRVTTKVNSILKEYLKKGNSWLTETELLYLDERK